MGTELHSLGHSHRRMSTSFVTTSSNSARSKVLLQSSLLRTKSNSESKIVTVVSRITCHASTQITWTKQLSSLTMWWSSQAPPAVTSTRLQVAAYSVTLYAYCNQLFFSFKTPHRFTIDASMLFVTLVGKLCLSYDFFSRNPYPYPPKESA